MTKHFFHAFLATLLIALVCAAMGEAKKDQGRTGLTLAEMMKGARKLVATCVGVKSGESVLIVTDSKMMTIALALSAAAKECGAEPIIAVIEQRAQDSTEPPNPVAAAMKDSDVIFSAVSISITHTLAAKNATAAGARMIALSAFTEEMMASGGLDADFSQVKVACNAVGERLAAAKLVHLTSNEGTDLTFQMQGRRVNVMPGMVGPGELSPVPNAEVNVSPVEGTANGVIVVDASIPMKTRRKSNFCLPLVVMMALSGISGRGEIKELARQHSLTDSGLNKLKMIPGTRVNALGVDAGSHEIFEIILSQPLDHENPSGKQFPQHILLVHRDLHKSVNIFSNGR